MACLHGGGGPQIGEVTRLGGVTRLSIQSLILMWSRLHVRWGNPPHVTSPTWGTPPSCKQALKSYIQRKRMRKWRADSKLDGIKRESVVCTSVWVRSRQSRGRLRQLWVPLSVENNVAIIGKKSLICKWKSEIQSIFSKKDTIWTDTKCPS